MRLVQALSFALALLLAPESHAEDPTIPAADSASIRGVIEAQMAAFARDDASAAFAFASPAIRAQFGTPDNFLHMVQAGYPPVYRPRSVSFAGARHVQEFIVQEVDLIGPDGAGVRAFYLMERESDGSWRINGVTLAADGEKEA
jgi:hypothetical protein